MSLSSEARSKPNSDRRNSHEKPGISYQWPVHAAVFRTFEQPNIEAYMAQMAVTREDYAALIKRRADCARQAAARR